MKSLATFVPALLVAALTSLTAACGDLEGRDRDDSDSDSDSDSDRDDSNETLPSEPNEPNEPNEPSEPSEPSEPTDPSEPVAPDAPNECELAGLVDRACDGIDVVACVDGRVERTLCDFGDVCLDDGEARCMPEWQATLAIEAPYFECASATDSFQLVLTSREAAVVRAESNTLGTVSFSGAEPNGAVVDVPGALSGTISNSVRGGDIVLSFNVGAVSCVALAYEIDRGSGDQAFTALYEHCAFDHEPGFYGVLWDLAFHEYGYVEGLEQYKDFLFAGDGDEDTYFQGQYHVDGTRLTIAFFDGPTFTGEVIDAEANVIFLNEFGDNGLTLSPGQN
jgi:hypothetical protein